MDVKTIIYWILAAALIWFLLSLFFGRSMNRTPMYGGMDAGVFDQLASNSGLTVLGNTEVLQDPEDAYLMYPDYNYGYVYGY